MHENLGAPRDSLSLRGKIPGRLFEGGLFANRPHVDPRGAFARKKRLTESWKPRTLRRDGNKCRACKVSTFLELAHITPVLEFLRLEGIDQDTAIRRSYREDNLLILCRWCHVAYDMNGRHDDPDPALEEPRAELESSRSAPEIERHRQLRDEEFALVKNIFGYIRSEGGKVSHVPPIYVGTRLAKAKARLQVVRAEIGSVAVSPPYLRWLRAEKAWNSAHDKVTRARRRRVARIVKRIEASRGWRLAGEAPDQRRAPQM